MVQDGKRGIVGFPAKWTFFFNVFRGFKEKMDREKRGRDSNRKKNIFCLKFVDNVAIFSDTP